MSSKLKDQFCLWTNSDYEEGRGGRQNIKSVISRSLGKFIENTEVCILSVLYRRTTAAEMNTIFCWCRGERGDASEF